MTNKQKRVSDGAGIDGHVELTVRDKDGNLKQLWNLNWFGRLLMKWFGIDIKGNSLLGFWDTKLAFHNLVTNAGFALVASRINGAGALAAATYLAVGVGTTAAAATDTTLQTEITDSGLARAAATCSRVTTTVTNDTAQLDKTWSVSGTKAVTEIGAFNAASSGDLLGRQVFSAVNVVSGDSLQATYKFKAS